MNPQKYFITGIGTDIGKTVISAILVGSIVLMAAGYSALVFGARGQLSISRLINPLMILVYFGLMYAVYNLK